MIRCIYRLKWASVDCRASQQSRTGVSLLEIIVAITLAMVMLGAVWSLANLLSKRYDAQLRLAEQNQITRSIQQRLSQDLNSIVYWNQEPSWQAETSGTDVADFFPLPNLFWPERLPESSFSKPSEVPAFSGNETELTFAVHTDSWAIAWSEYQKQARRLDGESSGVSDSPAPPLVHRVRYALVRAAPSSQSSAADLDDVDPHAEEEFPPLTGLTREEWEETPIAATANRQRVGDNDRALEKMRSAPGRTTAGEENRQMERPAIHRRERIEEIENLRFRYFDGNRWHRSWDSFQEGRLPCAILFQFSFAPKKSRSLKETPDEQFESEPFPPEIEPESELEEPELAELIADERFEFDFLFRLQTPARILQSNKSSLDQRNDVSPQGPQEAPR